MFNPECCGVPMWLEATNELVYQFIPGSPEILQLFSMAKRHPMMWACLDCGRFYPASIAA